jgi:toxin ParE1/3/4
MAFKFVIKPIVFAEAEDAVAYYEKKSKGLGKRFYDNFLTSLDDIQHKPFTFSYIKKPVRRHLVSKFPYKVYYLISDETIYIIGISHAKRSNAFVKRRLKLI